MEEGVGRQHQGIDGPGVRQVPEGSGEQGKMEKTGCKIIFGSPTTLGVKGLMMMMKLATWIICIFTLGLVYAGLATIFVFFFFKYGPKSLGYHIYEHSQQLTQNV